MRANTLGHRGSNAALSREELLESAGACDLPGEAAAAAFSDGLESFADALYGRMQDRADLETLIGPGKQDLMQEYCLHFCRSLALLFETVHVKAFVDSLLWGVRAYHTRGFESPFWVALALTTYELMQERTPEPALSEFTPFLDWIYANAGSFLDTSNGVVSGRGVPGGRP